MSGSGAALVSILLRDGTQLAVTPMGIQLGARFFELARIQDARQVSPDPVTFALRVAGVGLVEFQPTHPNDGALALDALFRLRPDLLPAGFVPPSGAPAYPPPPPPYPTLPGYSPPIFGVPPAGSYPSPPGYGYPPAPWPRPMYGPSANASGGEMTPVPRTFGEILSAVFQLYGKHFRKWLALGIFVAVVPAFLAGVLQVALYLAIGLNPWGSSVDLFPATSITTTPSGNTLTLPFHFPGADQLRIIALVALAASVLSIVFGAWQVGTLAVAARAAILGREVRIGDSLAGGFRRVFPVLGASILVGLVTLACFIPGFVLLIVLGIAGSLTASGFVSSAAVAAPLIGCIVFLIFAACGVVALFFGIRLGYAPYAAGADPVGPGAAVARSWRYSRGGWWRTFGIVLILGIIVGLITAVIGQIQIVSVAASLLVATPLLAAVATPFAALGWMVLWYDLRLRHEGYAGVTQSSSVPAATPPYGSSPSQG